MQSASVRQSAVVDFFGAATGAASARPGAVVSGARETNPAAKAAVPKASRRPITRKRPRPFRVDMTTNIGQNAGLPEVHRKTDADMGLPATLRTWFAVDTAIHLIAGLPLLIAPELVLPALGWSAVDPVTSRLLGAALVAMFWPRLARSGNDLEAARRLVAAKTSWAALAALASLLAVMRGAPPAVFAAVAVFVALLGVWASHAVRLRQYARGLSDLDRPSEGDSDGDREEPGGPDVS